MQISFTQDEVQDALKEYLAKQLVLAENQTVSFEFDLDEKDKTLVVYVDIYRDGVLVGNQPAKKETVKPSEAKPGRKNATSTTKAAPQPIASTPASALTAPAETKNDESKDPPFDTAGQEPVLQAGSPAENQETTSVVENETETADPVEAPVVEAVQPSSQPVKIFDNAASSAPITAAVSAEPGKKSLFANLTKPVHDAPKMH